MGPYAFSRNETPVFLAPMSGVTDAPFRKQVMKFGAETTITEMVAGDDLRNGNQDSENRIVVGHYPGIHTVQLVGREAEALRYGAERARHAAQPYPDRSPAVSHKPIERDRATYTSQKQGIPKPNRRVNLHTAIGSRPTPACATNRGRCGKR